jgi:NhaA family Na+:H+ antiporter
LGANDWAWKIAAGSMAGPINRLKAFIDSEAVSALPLLAATVLALAIANSPLAGTLEAGLETRLGVAFGPIDLAKPVRLWVNDGLMALFFLLVGLEIKRELLEGELSRPANVVLPVAGALGGMIVPAAIYLAFTRFDPAALKGWAIPTATDIAFSLGVLAVLGSRVPLALKVFLTTLAIVDDLGAIVIIAAFYTEHLSLLALACAALCIVALAVLNLLGVRRLWPFLLVGAALWLSVLKSGVHATLAGVVLALFIPVRAGREAEDHRPAIRLEHALRPWSAWLIMPVFALANAGMPLLDLEPAQLVQPVTLGVTLGLFLGKQAGILLGAGLPIVLRIARLPEGASWRQLYGVAILGGIGFTMSLFIGSLAFDDAVRAAEVRFGVLSGSALSALLGYVVLRIPQRRH